MTNELQEVARSVEDAEAGGAPPISGEESSSIGEAVAFDEQGDCGHEMKGGFLEPAVTAQEPQGAAQSP
jgi:hypothetical protein